MSLTDQICDLIEAPSILQPTNSGRVTWDERGNGVWEWQTAPGVYSREISAQQLQALQTLELELAETRDSTNGRVFHTAKHQRPRKSVKQGILAGLLGRQRD